MNLRTKLWWQRGGRLLAELLVVFVGVYAAFALSTWQQDQRDEARHQQILETLRSHVALINDELDAVFPRVDSLYLRPLLDSIEVGAMPPLVALNLNAGDTGTGLWEALLQSGGLDVLDAQTIAMMQRYFAMLSSGVEAATELRTLINEQLYPSLGRAPSEFYDTATGALRPKYGWYPLRLQRVRSVTASIDVAGDQVLAHLDSLLGRPPADSLAAS